MVGNDKIEHLRKASHKDIPVCGSFLFANFFFSAKKKLVGFAPVNELLGGFSAAHTFVGKCFLFKGNAT